MADSKTPKTQTKINGKLMFTFVKTIIDAGLEEEFLALCAKEKFYLGARPQSMKLAADFLRSANPKSNPHLFALAVPGAAPGTTPLMSRVCPDATCEF